MAAALLLATGLPLGAITGVTVYTYPSAASLPAGCDQPFGTQVADSCCDSSPTPIPFAALIPSPATCATLPALAPALPNISLAFYTNCEDATPVYGENCFPSWAVSSFTTGVTVGQLPTAPYSASGCEQGCTNTIRGVGCFVQNYPAEIAAFLSANTATYPTVAGLANLPVLSQVPTRSFVRLPATCTTSTCASYCNAYTCGLSSCSTCSSCTAQAAGLYCASWCNRWTSSFALCSGCPAYAAPSWCNAYVCGLSVCAGSSACTGGFCEPWCNSWTTSSSFCSACP